MSRQPSSTDRRTLIRGVQSEAELQETFAGRYEVFVGEDILSHRGDRQISDRYDHIPTTRNFIALQGGRIIGGIRATIGSDDGLPCDEFFNFSSHFTSRQHQTATGSLLWVKRDFRNSSVGMELGGVALGWGVSEGVKEVGIAGRPQAVPLFERLGFRTVGEQFDHPVERVPVIPMIVLLDHDATA